MGDWERIRDEQVRRDKARNLRYKKAALERLNLEDIRNELYDIGEECDNVKYFTDDEQTLLDAMDGDEEQEYEFRMMYADLCAKCENLNNLLQEEYISEYFDDIMVDLLGRKYKTIGFDIYEEDYYSLCGYESDLASKECGKRLMRLTKEQLLSACGQAIGIVVAFLDISQKYDYLKATFDILLNDNTSYMQMIREIEMAYADAELDGFTYWGGSDAEKRFDRLLEQLPDRAWIE